MIVPSFETEYQKAQKMVLQDVAGMIPESEPKLKVIPPHLLQLQGFLEGHL